MCPEQKTRDTGWPTFMKGITNAEIREKFEHIESELTYLKNKKQHAHTYIIFFSFATLTALIATTMMIINPHPLIMFFTLLGISQMVFLLMYRLLTAEK